MKVTVHLDMTDTQWGSVSDRAERAGLSVEQYITLAAIYGSATLDQQEDS